MSIERFFSKASNRKASNESAESSSIQSSKFLRVDVNQFDPPSDPGTRPQINEYHPSIREAIRRKYVAKGPFQPYGHKFRVTQYNDKRRSFIARYFDEWSWLEYSITKEAAFCFCCFLFGAEEKADGGFVKTGFQVWNKVPDRFVRHIGDCNSNHQQNECKVRDLVNERQSLSACVSRQSEASRQKYRTRLEGSLECVRYLLCQGMAFRGHDESLDSLNRGNYLELVEFLAKHSDPFGDVALANAPRNNSLTSSDFQKEMTEAAAAETTKAIIAELGDDLFSILIDESRDVSCKEQMALVIRFVRKDRNVIERFLGIIHVSDTSAQKLKEAMQDKLAKHNLCLSRVRGQGYDGASNMRGGFNGLKSLILRENPQAYYVHCFAHQLQLTLVAVAKKQEDVASLFLFIGNVQNTVGASCKRRDLLRLKQLEEIEKKFIRGELETGRGLNQETNLSRAGDTRWSSHYNSVTSLINLWPSVIEVLQAIEVDSIDTTQRVEARVLLDNLLSFDFVFVLHLMQDILGKSSVLSQALQRKDQDIINAIGLVKVVKLQFQRMRLEDQGWQSLLAKVSSFCNRNKISIPDMEQTFVRRGRPRRNTEEITIEHRYRVQIFYTVLDTQLQELNERFSEVNSDLLLCVACLNPREDFQAFNLEKLIKLALFYPTEFGHIDRDTLAYEFESYVLDVQMDERFQNIEDLTGLSKKLVETGKHKSHANLYLLLKLALLLPVATATVERAFSAMKIIKTKLRNRMCDDWMNDCLVTYIEKEVFEKIPNQAIMQYYQRAKQRRETL